MSLDDEMTVDALLLALDSASDRILSSAAASKEDAVPPTRSLPDMIAEQQANVPDRMPWPDDWFTRRDVGDARACQALWAAVLFDCIKSALDVSAGDKRGNYNVQQVASGWIGSQDFHIICALVGLNGTAVADRLRVIAANPILAAQFGMARKGRR